MLLYCIKKVFLTFPEAFLDHPQTTYIVPISQKECLPKKKASYYITQKSDGGHVYRVLNGVLCDPKRLQTWKSDHRTTAL